MRKRLAIFLSVVLMSFILPSNSHAALEGCPNTWNIKLPELSIKKYSKLSNNAKVYFNTSSLFGPDNSTKQMKGLKYPFDSPITQRFQQQYALKTILPEVYEKLNNLGRDAVWSSNYEIVSSNNQKIDKFQADYLFGIPARPWILYFSGIGNGTQIKWNLNISIKACSDYKISSNIFTLNNLEMSSASIDDFFKNSATQSYNLFDFKQEEIIRSRLDANKKLIEQARLNEKVALEQLGNNDLGGKAFQYFYLGTNPADCIDSISRSGDKDNVTPVSIVVKTSSCQVSVVADFSLGEQENCVTGSCTSDANYESLIKNFKSLGGDSWTGDLVEIDSFKINLKTSKINQVQSSTCLKGKVIKKVTGINPKCPAGYKKK
ncbi:hypothetical protein MCETARE7_00939 [Candidatus Nanopelagicaceae bacterium]